MLFTVTHSIHLPVAVCCSQSHTLYTCRSRCAVHSQILPKPAGHFVQFTFTPSVHLAVTITVHSHTFFTSAGHCVLFTVTSSVHLPVTGCSSQLHPLYTCSSLCTVHKHTLCTPAGHCLQFTVTPSVHLPVTVCSSQSNHLYTCRSLFAVHSQTICTPAPHCVPFTITSYVHLQVTVCSPQSHPLYTCRSLCTVHSHTLFTPAGHCVQSTVTPSVHLPVSVYSSQSHPHYTCRSLSPNCSDSLFQNFSTYRRSPTAAPVYFTLAVTIYSYRCFPFELINICNISVNKNFDGTEMFVFSMETDTLCDRCSDGSSKTNSFVITVTILILSRSVERVGIRSLFSLPLAHIKDRSEYV